MVCGYVRRLSIPEDWKGKTLLLTFEGAAHDAEVYVNGKPAGEHHCGYTAFTLDITSLVEYGKDNLVTVRLDTRETLNVPPFGYVIDYMTYGGLYRDVYLEAAEPIRLGDIFLRSSGSEVTAEVLCEGLEPFQDLLPDLVIRQSMRPAGVFSEDDGWTEVASVPAGSAILRWD